MTDSLPSSSLTARRHWMGVLARADVEMVAPLTKAVSLPSYERIRGPEIGLVMLRGRAGGDGAAFNFGEMTTTRCSVRTAAGMVGHAYVKGRNSRLAELAAVLDALLQDDRHRAIVMAQVIAPLEEAQREKAARVARRAAATRVDFLAMATMR